MKKSLISLTKKQDIFLRSLSEELGISLSELIRRVLDEYIENRVKDGTLMRFKIHTSVSERTLEMPKEMLEKMIEYVRDHPEGVITIM